MLPVLLLGLVSIRVTVFAATQCDPSRFLCAGQCPPLPEGIEPPTSEAYCSRDPDSDTCICWLHNPASQLQTLFQCEAKINGSITTVACFPPEHCFSPDPEMGCLIVLNCQCLLFDQMFQYRRTDTWKRVKAVVHTAKKNGQSEDGRVIEKVQDVRDFNIKHLLFLLGFVIAPLLCWCLLNFFHGGKCRKKPLQPPDVQRSPAHRSTTSCSSTSLTVGNEEETEQQPRQLRSRPASVLQNQHLPSAPELDCMLEADAQRQTLLKCESPPPYCESMDRNCHLDCGPPPTYDEAVRGSDLNFPTAWQTAVFIAEPAGSSENG